MRKNFISFSLKHWKNLWKIVLKSLRFLFKTSYFSSAFFRFFFFLHFFSICFFSIFSSVSASCSFSVERKKKRQRMITKEEEEHTCFLFVFACFFSCQSSSFLSCFFQLPYNYLYSVFLLFLFLMKKSR